MKWPIEIKDLTDDQLKNAKATIDFVHLSSEAKKADPKFEKKFENQPKPEINPAFKQLLSEIDTELTKRNLNS